MVTDQKNLKAKLVSEGEKSKPLKSVNFKSLNSPFTTAFPSQCGAGLETKNKKNELSHIKTFKRITLKPLSASTLLQ